MLQYVAEHLPLHLNQLTPTVRHCYIYVNMAKAWVVTVALVIFEKPEKKISVEQKKDLRGMVSLHWWEEVAAQDMCGLQLSSVG